MVALIPLAFASLVPAMLVASWCEADDCDRSTAGLWAWAGGIVLALLSTIVPARRTALALATTALLAPFAIAWIVWR